MSDRGSRVSKINQVELIPNVIGKQGYTSRTSASRSQAALVGYTPGFQPYIKVNLKFLLSPAI
jgi:hypothetical protein